MGKRTQGQRRAEQGPAPFLPWLSSGTEVRSITVPSVWPCLTLPVCVWGGALTAHAHCFFFPLCRSLLLGARRIEQVKLPFILAWREAGTLAAKPPGKPLSMSPARRGSCRQCGWQGRGCPSVACWPFTSSSLRWTLRPQAALPSSLEPHAGHTRLFLRLGSQSNTEAPGGGTCTPCYPGFNSCLCSPLLALESSRR